MTRTLLDPTSERTPSHRELLARPATLAGLRVGLLDISKARGNVFLDRLEELIAEREREGDAVREADVHQAGSDRSPSRDLDDL